MAMQRKKRTLALVRAFTLIELLVVIAIIGLLSSVVIASVNSARKRARDAKRREDLKTIQLALENYFDDHHQYPATTAGFTSEPLDAIGGFEHPGEDAWIPGLVPDYIKKLPRDPSGAQNIPCWSHYRAYLYYSNGSGYYILSHCAPESSDAFSATNTLVDPVRPTWAWKICSGTPCSM